MPQSSKMIVAVHYYLIDMFIHGELTFKNETKNMYRLNIDNGTTRETSGNYIGNILHLYRKDWLYVLYVILQQIDWLRYLQLIFNTVNITVNINQTVVVYSRKYYQQLGILLKETPPRYSNKSY